MAGLKLFHKRDSSGKDKSITTLGDGFYMEYDHVLNGLGGYHPVNIVLKDSRKHAYQITNENGWFTDFPGTKEGEWEERLDARILLPLFPIPFQFHHLPMESAIFPGWSNLTEDILKMKTDLALRIVQK